MSYEKKDLVIGECYLVEITPGDALYEYSTLYSGKPFINLELVRFKDGGCIGQLVSLPTIEVWFLPESVYHK